MICFDVYNLVECVLGFLQGLGIAAIIGLVLKAAKNNDIKAQGRRQA